jgi:hypothetical protein
MAALPATPMPSPTPEVPPLSEGARILNTFIAPSKTFTDLRRSASWWAPWLLIAIFSLLFVYVMDRQVGFEQVSKNQITWSPSRAEQLEKLPPDQRAQQLRISAIITRYISYSSPILVLLFFLVIAAVLMGTFNLVAGAGVPLKICWAIVIYSGLPGIIHAVLGMVSLFAGVEPEGFNINNPVATNPAYFMDPTGNKFLDGMASALDVFVWWGIVLMGIGFACNSKVKRSTAIAIVGGWYLLYKLAGAGLAAAFS